MEEELIAFLDEEASRYNLTENDLVRIINSLKEAYKNNYERLIFANKEDLKSYKKQINIRLLLQIIDSYSDKECFLSADDRKLIVYRGDPYLTLNICMQCLTKRIKCVLETSDFMNNVNIEIVRIFNGVLNEYNISNLIYYIQDYSLKTLEDVATKNDEIIVIGDTKKKNELKEQLKREVKFYPYNNMLLYCDSDSLSKLRDAICLYANENQLDLKIYNSNIPIEVFIEEAKQTKDFNKVIILTENVNVIDYCNSKVINKEVFINDNPFKEDLRFDDYLE